MKYIAYCRKSTDEADRQILGADFILKDKKLIIEAKGAFIFLRNKQNELFTKQNQGVLNSEAKNDSTISNIPSGAPDEVLARLPKFIRLFLSDGLLPDLVYALGLKTV